jgi:hypothetical protein
VYAYLWTPSDMIQLDLAPRLRNERQRLRWQTDHTVRSSVPIGSMAKRTLRLVEIMEMIVAEVRELQPYDAAQAKRYIALLELRAGRLCRRWPAWAYCAVAEHAAYRLLPLRVRSLPGSPVSASVRLRAEELQRTGRLRFYTNDFSPSDCAEQGSRAQSFLHQECPVSS